MMGKIKFSSPCIRKVVGGRNVTVPNCKTSDRISANAIISSTKMINHYGRTGKLKEAIRLFNEMPHKNQVSWNAMLTVLLRFGCLEDASELFGQMPERNSVSYNLMITGFSRRGFVSEARQLFDSIQSSDQNVFIWTAMISCYTQNHHPMDALYCFSRLYGDFFSERIVPNPYTFSVLLKSCAGMQSLLVAEHIHAVMVKLLDEESEENALVQNSLIDVHAKFGCLSKAENILSRMKWKDTSSWNIMMAGYARCLLIDKALGVFSSMSGRDVLSWNIIISGLAQSGRGEESLNFFLCMSRVWPEVKPNPSTYTVILTVCATITTLRFGKQIHGHVVRLGIVRSNIYIGNSLVTMYSRGGFINESELVFNEMLKKDIISWNSLILGFGQNGYARKALEVAENALKLKSFNHNTFVAILTSCSHGGLTDDGMEYFSSMGGKYGITPSLDHYICMIDMFGRVGRITEAYDLLLGMPFKANYVAWHALLSACLIHENREVGEIAAKELQVLEPNNVTGYLMLANICGKTGQFEESRKLLNLMRQKGLTKDPGSGCSWIIEV